MSTRLSDKEMEFVCTVTGYKKDQLTPISVEVVGVKWGGVRMPDGTRIVPATSASNDFNLFLLLVLPCPHCESDVFSKQRAFNRETFKSAHAHPVVDLGGHFCHRKSDKGS